MTPASVGVNQPPTIPPMMITGTSSAQPALARVATASWTTNRGCDDAYPRRRTMRATKLISISAMNAPGRKPARNSWPTDTWTSEP